MSPPLCSQALSSRATVAGLGSGSVQSLQIGLSPCTNQVSEPIPSKETQIHLNSNCTVSTPSRCCFTMQQSLSPTTVGQVNCEHVLALF